MSRLPFILPPAVLAVLMAALGLLAVEGTIALVAPQTPATMTIALRVAAALVGALVGAIAVRWVVVAPLRRILGVVYHLAEGDFSIRSGALGVGITANVLHGLDDLAGLLESRWETARASERRYRLLYDNSPAGLFRTRLDGRVVECNMTAVRMMGYDSLIDAKTRNARTFWAEPGQRDIVLGRLVTEGLISNLVVNFRRKDGRVLPVLLTIGRTVEADGPYFEGQFLDATGLVHGSAPRPMDLAPERGSIPPEPARPITMTAGCA